MFLVFNSRVVETKDYAYVFPIGLRMDLILLCYLLFLPLALIVLIPDPFPKKTQGFFYVYFIFFLTVVLFMEMATFDFIKQYDTRPNKLFIDYLIYPQEVLGMLLKSYLGSLIITGIVLVGFVYTLIRFRKPLFQIQNTPYTTKLLLFPIAAFFVFFGARSSLTSKRPINASNAIFSTDHLTNSLGLNSTYTVAFSLYAMKNEKNAEKMYGKMDYAEAISRVKKYMDVKPNEFTNDSIFTPQKLNVDLSKDAFAHVISAFYMYNQKKYRLK